MAEKNSIDVLLVEDSPDHIELASRVFQKINPPLHIKIIQDAEEALNFLWGREYYKDQGPMRPLLTILDLYLPKMSGSELLRQLRLDPRTRDLSIAILTITGNEQHTLTQDPYLVKHYLRKPLELNSFLELYNLYIKKK